MKPTPLELEGAARYPFPMRKMLSYALAQRVGQTVTVEMAREMLRELFPDKTRDPASFGEKSYQGFVFRCEHFDDVLPELHHLHEMQWQETERARDGLAMRPNYEHMREAERRGEMLQFTARCDGKLVGGIRIYVFHDLHTQTPAAKEDTFYLLPEARKGWVAIRFWQFAEQSLASIGVIEVRTDSKLIYDEQGSIVRDVGRLNQAIGYQHVSNGYLKRLTPAAPRPALPAPLSKE